METQQSQTPNPFAASGMFVLSADVWRAFKMALEGWAGDGKSHTAGLVAIGIWKTEGEKGTIVLQDTEEAAKFYGRLFRPYGIIEGKNFFVTPSRSLTDTRKLLELCERERAILIIDTVTHLYEDMVKAYLEANDRTKIEPQDHMSLKPKWKELFATPYVRAQCHVIFTGRAAWEYTMEKNEETKKKEFYKSGVKMRGDNETAFEPDLLVLMEKEQKVTRDGVGVAHFATVMKDRSTLIHGRVFENPTFADFEPVYKFLCVGNAQREKVKEGSMAQALKVGADRAWFENRRKAEIFLEEIEGLFQSYLPGQGPKEKKVQADIFYTIFETRSKTALGEMKAETLLEGKRAVEFLLQELTAKRDWLAKMQEDKTQAFDLAQYIKGRYDEFKAKLAKAADDDIPLFTRAAGVGNGEGAAQSSGGVKAELIEDIVKSLSEAETPVKADEIFESYVGAIDKMGLEDRRRCAKARDKRKNELRKGVAAVR